MRPSLQKFLSFKAISIVLVLLLFFAFWTYKGVLEADLHADLSRDLGQISNLWIHRIVWLGPQLRVGFPISPLYFYLLFPGVILSGGNAYSLIVTHTLLATIALASLALMLRKLSTRVLICTLIAVGLSPWWMTAASHAWNGHLYVGFVLLALVSVWTRKHFFLSSLLFGTAVAIHPAALLVAPVFGYEWLHSQQKIKDTVYLIAGLLLPWTPIFVFEYITKGFLTREWLAHPNAGMQLSFGMTNIYLLAKLMRIQWILLLGFWIACARTSQSRLRGWIIGLSLSLFSLLFVSALQYYYVFGLICALMFVLVVAMSPKKWGQVILCLLVVWYGYLCLKTPFTLIGRSISRTNMRVDEFIRQTQLDRSKTYALVSVNDSSNSTPQADDYRFFFRTKGYKALNIDDYPTADRLILFIEAPDFTWQNWTDWHMEHFGPHKVLRVEKIFDRDVVIYERK